MNKNTYDDKWILENWEEYRNWNSLCKAYNEKFGTDILYRTFKGHCNNKLGLNFLYTKEQEDWLRENYPNMGSVECTAEFNKIFNTNRTSSGVRGHCIAKLGLRVTEERKSRLAIENTGRYHEPGTILTSRGKDDYLYLKQADGSWELLHRAVYKELHKDLPDDYVVIFLDGDRHNCKPNNLAAIPRKYITKMTKNKFWSEFPEVTKTGLVWCELDDALDNYELEKRRI